MKMKSEIKKFLLEEDGLTTVEYAIAGSLVGAAVIAAFGFLGDAVNLVITNITSCLNGGACT
jgi:pilus assembly protein Flp/PilA